MNTQLIEKYQEIYQKDPRSKIFASLSEAYRKLKMPDRAFEVATRGVSLHPNFIGGLVALGRCAIDLGELEVAQKSLEKACSMSRENLLAHQLLAEIYLTTGQPKAALKTYKTVLFYNPTHVKALKVVKKLESLSADDFEDDIFEMTPLTDFPEEPTTDQFTAEPTETLEDKQLKRALERHLSIIDALISRNEIEKVDLYLKDAQRQFSDHPEIKKRLLILQHRGHNSSTAKEIAAPEMPSRAELSSDADIQYLQKLLQRVKSKNN